MGFVFEKNETLCKMEIYNEYLKKIPQLFKQIEIVEKMMCKADIERQMLKDCDEKILSVQKYNETLQGIQNQCKERRRDLKEELNLIMHLKSQIEKDLPFHEM